MINPKLFRGINQWRRESCYKTFDGSIPLNSYWNDIFEQKAHMINKEYLPIGNRLMMGRAKYPRDNFYRFTTCIYSSQQKNVPLTLSVIQTLADGSRKRLGSYSVYMNNKRLVAANNEVSLNFEIGWNEIQILYHWGDMERRKDIAPEQLPTVAQVGKHNFIQERKVRADLDPLKLVNVHDLFHNVVALDDQKFAIYESQVVLNYLPKDCIFQLTYEKSYEKKEDRFAIVRASLKRNNETPTVTPKIYSIQLRMR